MTTRNADLSLRDLRVLDVLLRERSLTRAAEQLGTTQPSISKVLARLRARFADPILTRSGQEMHPTPKALESRTAQADGRRCESPQAAGGRRGRVCPPTSLP